jgi:hypothetical protein
MKESTIFSYGAGVQSTALMVLMAKGDVPKPDAFVFANVGNDSEKPETLEYLETYARPFAEAHGIEIVEVQHEYNGQPETLLEHIRRTQRSIPIPAFMENGAPGNRTCTQNFKVNVVDKWIKAQGITHATIQLGFSIDEFRRTATKSTEYLPVTKRYSKRFAWPLIDLKLTRLDCMNIIGNAGLPVPPSSLCWWCPFHPRGAWVDKKREKPAEFAACVALENEINEKRKSLGRDRVYLYPMTGGVMRPLEQAVGDQLPLWELFEETCPSGYCGL